MISVKKTTDVLIEIAESDGADTALQTIDRYLASLSAKHLWHSIADELRRRETVAVSDGQITVTTANDETAPADRALASIASNSNNQDIARNIDKRLLGGYVVEDRDTKMDLTVRKQLNRLEKILQTN